MSLEDLLREVVASGRLAEPFTAPEAARVLNLPEWSLPKVQNYLARHCIGNLAATALLVERVSYGRYRLIYDGPREDGPAAGAADCVPYPPVHGSDGWPGDSQS